MPVPPPAPVTDTLPPLDVIVELVPVTKTPLLVVPVPVRLPPLPSTVTVPLPPAVIWPAKDTWTPALVTLVLAPPPVPVTETLPPLDLIAPLNVTATP